ncbi:GOLPH3/VPS74 family protein [Longispora albida]|uniref:GOLPH3/VPS74 family protein n=1 Tax=Longispora albida TaxID=203523 RepID=UPI00036E9297|nr:GPP34 family phosphoprotein [Longispora albida]
MIADDLFFLGNGHVHVPHLGIALGAGLLADLVLSGRIGVSEHGRLAIYDRQPTGWPFADSVLGALITSPDTALGEWLRIIGSDAWDRVSGGLLASGTLRRVTTRKLLVPVTKLEPADPELLGRLRARLRYAVHAGELTEADAALICLAQVLQIEGRAFLDGVPKTVSALAGALHPALRTIVTTASATIASNATSAYR